MNWFWDNIQLKKEDRIGMLVFLCILFCLILVKWYMVVLHTPGIESYNAELLANVEYTIIESDIHKNEIDTKSSLQPIKKKWKSEKGRKNAGTSSKEIRKKEAKKEAQLFDFDPNKVSLDSLLLLGIGKYAANNITKYRTKGGKFYKGGDLQRIYGIDSLLFLKISPYVNIKKQEQFEKITASRKKPFVNSKPKLELNSIDINLADTTEFRKLKGIGKVYANRMVKFRSSLGGYFSIDQIKDVWGISDSLFTSIKPYLSINTALVKKRNINSIDKNTLVKHPYIDWKKANVILSYKKMHGDYQSMDDFEKMHGISDDFVDTLKQYFIAQ